MDAGLIDAGLMKTEAGREKMLTGQVVHWKWSEKSGGQKDTSDPAQFMERRLITPHS